MKHVLQFIDLRDGTRTPVFHGTPADFVKVILGIIEKDENFDPDHMAVLSLMDIDADNPDNMQWSTKALLTAANFIKIFGDSSHAGTIFSPTVGNVSATTLQSSSGGDDSAQPIQQESFTQDNIRCGTIDPGVCG